MIDVNLIREDADLVKSKLLKKGVEVDFTPWLEADKRRKEIIGEVEAMKARKNKVSSEIPALKKAGQPVDHIFKEMKDLGTEIAKLDEERAEVEKFMQDFICRLPNLPDDDVIAGGKESNEVVKVFGEKPVFDYEPKNHVDLCTSLGLIDYERGVKVAGNGSWIYRGMGSRLEWAQLLHHRAYQRRLRTHTPTSYARLQLWLWRRTIS